MRIEGTGGTEMSVRGKRMEERRREEKIQNAIENEKEEIRINGEEKRG